MTTFLRGVLAAALVCGVSVDGRAQAARATQGAGGGHVVEPVEAGVRIRRFGRDDCLDLPRPPAGVPGLREYARFEVTRDGAVTVGSAQLPFSSNEGYLYRLTPTGWERNELDFVLIRTPMSVLGGYTYMITFGTGDDRCDAWSIEVIHPG